MQTIRTIIVEDEPLARQKIRQYLDDEPDVVVVGECANGREAADAIGGLAPDLVFLDISIPEMDGFQVLETLGEADELPLVVFVTAYAEYALQGFEVNALDYLLKPFDDERFGQTMNRVRTHLDQVRDAGISRRLKTVFQTIENDSAPEPPPERAEDELHRILIRESGRVFFLKSEEIHWIEASGNYVRLHVQGKSHLVRFRVKELEARLPGNQFVRIHRGTIVNLEQVREIQPYFHGDYRVILHDGTRLKMSRRYRSGVLKS
jgi:two-component system LytT family response regulator